MKRRILFAALLLIVSGMLLAQQSRPAPSVRPLSFEQLSREIKYTASPVLVVHFWATWCEPCRHEFPVWAELIRESDASQVSFILISADAMEDRDQVDRFLAQFKISSHIIQGNTQDFLMRLSDEWAGALPATFIFERERGVIDFWEGGLPDGALRHRVMRSVRKEPDYENAE